MSIPITIHRELTVTHLPRLFRAGIVIPLALTAIAFQSAKAQDVMDPKSAAHLRDEYTTDLDTVHVKIMALANAIPEEKYGWRPAPGVRSISEALMHVAAEWYFFVPGSLGGKPPADFGPPRETLPKLEKITTKAAVLAELEKSWTHSKAQLGAADPATLTAKYKPWGGTLAQSAFVMSGDLHEHLGQLITYARSVGVKPPWSKQ
jgi:uncharacterized damage-inducible protein DinB